MVKKEVSGHAIPKSITNLLNAYIQYRNNCEDLTNINRQLKAAIEVGDKTKFSVISKKHKELCKIIEQSHNKIFKEGFGIRPQLPKDFPLLRGGMSLAILQQNQCGPALVSNFISPTNIGSFQDNEGVSGRSNAYGNSDLWDVSVTLHAWLDDSIIPDPLPHFQEDSFIVGLILECIFPAPEVDSLLLWNFDTPFSFSFVQGADRGSASLSWCAFSFPTGSIFPFQFGPFLSLYSDSQSFSIESTDKSMHSTMNVSAGRQAKLWLYSTLLVRAYNGRVLSDAWVDIFDGYGNRGIHYYLIPL